MYCRKKTINILHVHVLMAQTQTQKQNQEKQNHIKQVLGQLDLDCDACALYGASSPSCVNVIRAWRQALEAHPEYIDIIAQVYSDITGCSYSLVRAVLSLFARGNSDPDLLDAIFAELDGILCTSAYAYDSASALDKVIEDIEAEDYR